MLANLPHSGLAIPNEMRRQLKPRYQHFLPNQDWHLNRLYEFLPELGVPMLSANFSRYVVDLNRPLKAPLLGSFWSSPIAQQTAFKQDLYSAPPEQESLNQRIQTYYLPYHARLQQELESRLNRHGRVLLLDLHSFASGLDADVCLGTGGGTTASEHTLTQLESAFSAEKFACVKNQVFNGGHITRHYGAMQNVETVQIELHYRSYLEPQQLDRASVPDWNVAAFHQTQSRLKAVFQRVMDTYKL